MGEWERYWEVFFKCVSGKEAQKSHPQPEPARVSTVSSHVTGRPGETGPRRTIWIYISLQRRQWPGGGPGRQLPPLCR